MCVHSEECVPNGHLISPLTRTHRHLFSLSVSLWRLLTNTRGEDKQTASWLHVGSKSPKEEEQFTFLSRIKHFKPKANIHVNKVKCVPLRRACFCDLDTFQWLTSTLVFNDGVVEKVSVQLVKENCSAFTARLWYGHIMVNKLRLFRHFKTKTVSFLVCIHTVQISCHS